MDNDSASGQGRGSAMRAILGRRWGYKFMWEQDFRRAQGSSRLASETWGPFCHTGALRFGYS